MMEDLLKLINWPDMEEMLERRSRRLAHAAKLALQNNKLSSVKKQTWNDRGGGCNFNSNAFTLIQGLIK